MFTFYFILAISVIIGISRIGQAFQAGYGKACETQRRIEMHDARLRESKVKIAESDAKRQLMTALAEMKAAEIGNKVVLQEIKIEREKLNAKLDELKVRKEMNAQGLLTAEFTPVDYDSDRAPVTPIQPAEFTPENYS